MIRLRQNLMEMDAVIFNLGNVLLKYDPRRYLKLLKKKTVSKKSNSYMILLKNMTDL